MGVERGPSELEHTPHLELKQRETGVPQFFSRAHSQWPKDHSLAAPAKGVPSLIDTQHINHNSNKMREFLFKELWDLIIMTNCYSEKCSQHCLIDRSTMIKILHHMVDIEYMQWIVELIFKWNFLSFMGSCTYYIRHHMSRLCCFQ